MFSTKTRKKPTDPFDIPFSTCNQLTLGPETYHFKRQLACWMAMAPTYPYVHIAIYARVTHDKGEYTQMISL